MFRLSKTLGVGLAVVVMLLTCMAGLGGCASGSGSGSGTAPARQDDSPANGNATDGEAPTDGETPPDGEEPDGNGGDGVDGNGQSTSAQLIQPEDLTYLGAFRLPDPPADAPYEESWEYSGQALA